MRNYSIFYGLWLWVVGLAWVVYEYGEALDRLFRNDPYPELYDWD